MVDLYTPKQPGVLFFIAHIFRRWKSLKKLARSFWSWIPWSFHVDMWHTKWDQNWDQMKVISQISGWT